MTRQDFILNTLRPYFLDPSTCASSIEGTCLYLTPDGRKCALGKHLLPGPYNNEFSAEDLFEEYGDKYLTPEAKEQKLTPEQWGEIQQTHDWLYSYSTGKQSAQSVINQIGFCESACQVDLSELKDLLN